jgi:hypothetical protein
MPLSTLSDELCAHVASFLCLTSLLRFREACRSLNRIFLNHIDGRLAVWTPIIVASTNLMWNMPSWMEFLLKKRASLLTTLHYFRPSQALPTTASECIGIFAVVKSAVDHTTLGVACSLELGTLRQHEWEDGTWCFVMDITWRTDRTSVVKHTLANTDRAGDRWVVKTSIHLYLLSMLGVTKLAAVDVDTPKATAFGASADLPYNNGDDGHTFVVLHADTVTLKFHDETTDYWDSWDDAKEAAKQSAVAELRKSTKTILEYEPVFRLVCDVHSAARSIGPRVS